MDGFVGLWFVGVGFVAVALFFNTNETCPIRFISVKNSMFRILLRRHELKIREEVVGAVRIDMVDLHSIGDRAIERFPDEPVYLGAVTSAIDIEPDSLVAFRCGLLFHPQRGKGLSANCTVLISYFDLSLSPINSAIFINFEEVKIGMSARFH